ncbi:MAG: MgtC/SapB family protein [bacterium]|nr:MgtC/SapB family protein [bacterium]
MENVTGYINELIFASELTYHAIFLRLTLAVIAGGLIGQNRERHFKPAGLRTHIIICTGATLLMILSIYLPSKTGGDPGRIAAQVVTGIGFLGAGAIFRLGFNVRGLTSAASIWTTAAIGLTIGAGMYAASVFAATIILLTLNVLNIIELKFFRYRTSKILSVTADKYSGAVSKIIDCLEKKDVELKDISIEEDIETGKIELKSVVYILKREGTRKFFEGLRDIEGIKKISLE